MHDKKFTSDMKIARGSGSAKAGTHHFIAQRFSAIALIPLNLWFIFSLVSMGNAPYQGVVAWVENPLSATLLILLVVLNLYHMFLGLQVVLEDYVHCKVIKFSSLIALKIGCIFLGAITILAVLDIVLGG